MEKEQAELIGRMLYHAKELAWDQQEGELWSATVDVMQELSLTSTATENDVVRNLFYETN